MRNLDRRQFLKGAGTTLALPYLISLQSGFSKEKNSETLQKMVFLAFGWGATKETWFANAKDTGPNYKLPEGLSPLARHKKDFTIVQNTQHKFSTEAHWGSTFYLTGANRYAVPGKSFSNTISVDQIAAAKWGEQNRFSSLQFDCTKANDSGHGPGLSLSWNEYGKPLPGLSDPFLAYNKLFGNENMSIEQKRALISKKGSSLDAVLLDAKRIQRKINSEDKDKLNEYFQSVREIELQLAKEEAWMGKPKPKAPIKEPKEGLEGYEEIKLMYDLMVAALQTNSTRVISYRQPVTSLLKSMGASITPHNMSHYSPTGDRFPVSKERDLKQSELLAYFFDKLKATKDINGQSLFETTTIGYGSNIKHSHTLNNCPAIVAGNTKNLKLGEHLYMPKGTPLCNLWLTLLKGSGIEQESFGDSNGLIEDILA
ncbi:MAG: DUF1552 domain-containing protein [Lentisphaeraceae bacterium]|nr:DUF1552 domain-containing protein [Lentisphaeraceae bacterium]